MNKRLLYYSLPVVAVAAFLAYRAAFAETKETEKQPDERAAAEDAPSLVKARRLAPGRLESKVVSNGALKPNEAVTLSAEASGKAVEILFEEGQRVQKGALLLRIDDSELQAQLDKARRELEYLDKKLARDERLRQKGGVSQEAYESTLRDKQTKQAEIDLIEAQIDKTRLTAPFSGVIGLRYVSQGAYLTPSTQVAELVDLTPLKLEFSVPEKYMGRIGKGNEASFTVAGATERYRAKVYAVNPQIDTRTRTFTLRALVTNADERLLPGAFASVEVVLDVIEDALLVPTQAVIPEMDGKKVFVVREGKAVSVRIEAGIRTETELQALSGLAEGDTVITSGIMALRDGSPVKIIEIEG